MPTKRTISIKNARRLAITCQGLAGNDFRPDQEGIMQLFGEIGCIQIDPIRAVERTQLLVLFSRLGKFDPADLDTLLYDKRELMEYFAHAASIVMVEDYPIHSHHMSQFPQGSSSWERKITKWVSENTSFREYIRDHLSNNGPLRPSQFEDKSVVEWESGGWTSRRNIAMMIDFMWRKGDLMVANRQGGRKFWDLSENCLPDWTPRMKLDSYQVVYQAAQRSLHALGVATAAHISRHFIRGRYPNLDEVMHDLERDGLVIQVQIEDGKEIKSDTWFALTADLPLLDKLEAGQWQPRTVLLSPFDNLICNRKRTETLFDYHFRIEIYVPKQKRQYGYYVMSILHGDNIIGRIDPKMDRKNAILNINAVHIEPNVIVDEETRRAVEGSIEKLAEFLGAQDIHYHDDLLLKN